MARAKYYPSTCQQHSVYLQCFVCGFEKVGNSGYLTVRSVHVLPQYATVCSWTHFFFSSRFFPLHGLCSTPPVVYPNLIRNRRT